MTKKLRLENGGIRFQNGAKEFAAGFCLVYWYFSRFAFRSLLAKCCFRSVFLHQMSFSQGSATFRFRFWIYFSCGFSAVAFSLNFSIYVVGSPLACPLGRLGPFPHPLVSLVSANHATTLNLVQPPWNFVAEFGIAGNPNKGYSVCSQLNQTEH